MGKLVLNYNNAPNQKNMRNIILIVSAIIASFIFGYSFRTIAVEINEDKETFRKVTGIGGIFFKCENPKLMKEWYQKNLGIKTNQYGAVFEWRQGVDTLKKGFTQWSPFTHTTKYFEPSTKDYMINYRVENIENLVNELKKDSVQVVDEIETYDYGKFVHILDIEGNKIELWEPNDSIYEKMGIEMGLHTTK